jgi:hypothetical protein
MAKLLTRFSGRRIKAFYLICTFGIVGVLPDVDHIVCWIIGRGVFDPQASDYGCRLWHPYLLYISGYLCWLGFTLGIGLLLYSIQHAIRASDGDNNTWMR